MKKEDLTLQARSLKPCWYRLIFVCEAGHHNRGLSVKHIQIDTVDLLSEYTWNIPSYVKEHIFSDNEMGVSDRNQ